MSLTEILNSEFYKLQKCTKLIQHSIKLRIYLDAEQNTTKHNSIKLFFKNNFREFNQQKNI